MASRAESAAPGPSQQPQTRFETFGTDRDDQKSPTPSEKLVLVMRGSTSRSEDGEADDEKSSPSTSSGSTSSSEVSRGRVRTRDFMFQEYTVKGIASDDYAVWLIPVSEPYELSEQYFRDLARGMESIVEVVYMPNDSLRSQNAWFYGIGFKKTAFARAFYEEFKENPALFGDHKFELKYSDPVREKVKVGDREEEREVFKDGEVVYTAWRIVPQGRDRDGKMMKPILVKMTDDELLQLSEKTLL